MLHNRFRLPELWKVFTAHVRRGGYASDLDDPETKRELAAYRGALKQGRPAKLKLLRKRDLRGQKWWDRLTLDPRSRTDPKARRAGDRSPARRRA
jgi:hypothetical protein